MKKITFLIAALLVSLQMAAVPAKPVKRTLTLADGTTVTATLHGDEYYHFYVTDDGRALTEVTDGIFDYSDINEESQNWAKHRNSKFKLRQSNSQTRRIPGKPNRIFGVPGKVVGEKRGLVILVNFADNNKKMKHTQTEFYDQFNEVGYSKNRHIGSVRDYFKTQSYDQLTIDFDVVGPYELSHEMAYYGRNAKFVETAEGYMKFSSWNNGGDDVNAFEMIYEACQAANPDVNFKDYDWDGDGYVDQVYVIYAGYGEASGAASNTIWPHEYELSRAALYIGLPNGYPDLSTFANLRLDGVRIDTYACSNELSGISGTLMDGIGTACHEFTHCLGIPDMYDINYGGNFGMGSWSLMDMGSYNGPSGYEGSVPAAYTAYERWFSGWLEPVELNEGANINGMPAITDEPLCYIVYNQKNRNEYYLLQNIQQKSWNKYAGGHGMIVQHVFYDRYVWQSNEVNTYYGQSSNTYQRCTIIPADNKLSSSSLSGDPYPSGSGTNKKTALTNTSTPSASLYVANSDGRKYMNRPIEDITETNGLISFIFNGGKQIDAPVAEEVAEEDKSETSFLASWSEVEAAESYTVELTEYLPKEEQETPSSTDEEITMLLDEDFSKLQNMTNAGLDLSTTLDTYTQLSGWQGVKVFSGYANSGPGGVKLGSASATGSLTTPELSAPASGCITVLVDFKKYNNDTPSVKVSITPTIGQNITQTFTAEGSHVLTAEVSSSYTVTIETTVKRAYVTAVKVAEGTHTASEMVSDDDSGTDTDEVQTVVTTFTVDAPVTEYLFSDLSNASTYSYRVLATDAAGNKSDWSNVVSVTLPSIETGIECVTELTASRQVEVYTLSGLRIKSSADAANWSEGLPRGTYIVKSGHIIKKVSR